MKGKYIFAFLFCIVLLASCGKVSQQKNSRATNYDTRISSETIGKSDDISYSNDDYEANDELNGSEEEASIGGIGFLPPEADSMEPSSDIGSFEETEESAETSIGATETATEETNFFTSDGDHKELKWEEFYALSGPAKDAYMESFEDDDAFIDWMKTAKEKFKEEHKDIVIGIDGSIDLSKIK